jgi:hypothetical protein
VSRRWTTRLGAVAVGMLLVLGGSATAALAHGDTNLADDRLALAPGEAAEFTAGLHYHRVAATVTADTPVVVEVVRDETGAVVGSAGPDTTIALNRLVRCCPDAAWSDHTLVVRNPGPTSTTAAVRARLVHDDLAVMVDGAEPGTRASIVVLGMAWAALLWRAVRRKPHDVPLRRALGRLGAVAAGVLVLAAWGAWRYGAGGAPALLAGFADLPVLPFNPIVSRATLLVAATMVLWGRAGTAWARASDTSTPAWWATGGALVGSTVVVAALVADSYGAAGSAVGAAVAAGVPLLAVPVLRRSGRAAAVRLRPA